MSYDGNKRIANWFVKTDPGRAKEAIDAQRERMLDRYSAAVTKLCEMELAVKKVLDQSGVQTVLYVSYLNFGRQLYKLSSGRGVAGDSFALAAQVLLEKWARRGCDPEVLATIRRQVFNIGAPPTP